MKIETSPLKRALSSGFSNNRLDAYRGTLEVDPRDVSEFRGLILDLGSGGKERFARALQASNDKVAVINVNPKLVKKGIGRRWYGRRLRKNYEREGTVRRSVAALAQGSLPFRDQSFEYIFALSSVPKFLTRDELIPLFEEVYRVLKPGGKACFWPAMYGINGNRFAFIIHGDLGVPYRLEESPPSSGDKVLIIEKPLE